MSQEEQALQAGQSHLAAADPAADAAIAAALTALASAGSYFTGAERLAMCMHARCARGLSATAPEVRSIIATSVARVATEAMHSRQEHVAAWQTEGLDVLAFVEMVSVVAQISAIDSYRIGLGAALDPLPAPVPGEPTGASDERAVTSNAWVPTVGVALAPTALNALPVEKAAKDAMAKEWYLTDEFVHKYDVEPGRELTRAQMELVASRTSYLNECFF